MDATAPRSPYIGLQPFTEGQKALFFGRDREVRLVGANALASKLTVVYGASGVGKSSLLWAGVLPDLRQRPGTAAVLFRDWQHADAPAQLRAAVRAAADQAAGHALGLDAALPLDELLATVAAALHGTTVLMLDQFEEYFRYHPPGGAADAFDAELARAVNRRDVDAGFVISIREDSLSQLDRYRARIPAVLANPLRIRHLSERAARDAIVKPVQACRALPGWEGLPLAQDPEEALVAALLAQTRTGRVSMAQGVGGRAVDDADEQRVEAAYLQLVLARLWETECARRGDRLHEATLAGLGGAATIVRTHLDQVMARFPRDDRRLCAALFDRMVTPSGTKIACRVDDLRQWAPAGLGANVDRVIGELAGPGARILRAIDPRPGEPPQFEIFHDVLALGVIDWRTREAALAEGERQQRLQRRRRVQLMTAAVITLASAALGAFSFVQWRLARQNENEALAASFASTSLIASADPVSALGYAISGAQTVETPRSTVALRLAVARMRLRARIDAPPQQPIAAAAIADDGAALALWLADGGVEIRTLPTLDVERRWPAATLPATRDASGQRLVYRRAAQQLLVAGGRTLVRWDAATGQRTTIVPRGERRVLADAGGRLALLVDGADRSTAIDPATGSALALRGCGGMPLAVSAVPTPIVVERARRADAALQVCDARTGRVQGTLALDPERRHDDVSAGVFSADGQWFATRDLLAEEVYVWHVASGRRTTLRDFTAAPQQPFFVGAGSVAVPVFDGRIEVWRLSALDRTQGGSGPARNELLARLQASQNTRFVAPVDAAATQIVSVDDEGLSLWQTGTPLSPPLADGQHVAHAVWADGAVHAVLRDGSVGRIGEDGVFVTGELPSAPAHAVRASPDGERVLVLGADGRVVVWSLLSLAPMGELAADGPVADVAWAGPCCAFTVRRPDGRVTLHEWRARDGLTSRVSQALAPQAADGWLTPDRRHWLARDGGLAPAAAPASAPAETIRAEGKPVGLAWPFAADGSLLAIVGDFFPALVAPTAVRKLEGHSGPVNASDMGADGSIVVTGSEDWHALVWSVQRVDVPPVRLTGHMQPVTSVAAARPLPQFVATTGRDATLRIWERDSGEMLARAALPGPGWRVLDFRHHHVVLAGPQGGLRVVDCEPCWPAARLLALAEGRRKAVQEKAARRR